MIEKRVVETCIWTYDSDDYYDTSCGQAFTIIEGTPKENNMRYCHYCGKKLRVKESNPAEGER